jgi:tRNA (guanine-N7-)-methyltransferase
LKTDSDRLYQYTQRIVDLYNCRILDQVDDIYAERPDDNVLSIKTFFERKHLQNEKIIKFLEFQLPKEKIEERW